jgi:hypothetical protein
MRRVLCFACAAVFGCTSDLPAPNNYEPSSAGIDSAGGLDVTCDDIPAAAVGAEYAYTPTIDGAGGAMLSFVATNLPAGLSIDAATGEITGVPEAEGTATIEVTVTSDDMMNAIVMCELDVNPTLDVDLDLVVDTVPFCLRPGNDTLLDIVVEGTGDGSPITCTHDRGVGDGRPPAGISVNADTCEIEGTIDEERFGTWVFIVRGEQNGRSVHVPYCITNDMPTGYSISMEHSGLGDMGIDGTLVPITRRYNPNAAIDFGGGGDPLVEITDTDSDPSCGTNACFYGYSFSVNTASPFEGTPSFTPNDLLRDEETDQPIGFFHEIEWGRGSPVDEEFRTRPWAVNIDLWYCIADSAGPCDGDNVRANGEAEFEASILMIPE